MRQSTKILYSQGIHILLSSVGDMILKLAGLKGDQFVDVFASKQAHVFPGYWDKGENGLSHNWGLSDSKGTRIKKIYGCSLNTLAPPKVVQDVILAILGVVTQYVAPFIADDSDTANHLDHITVQSAKDRARYAFDASRDSLQDDRTLGLTRSERDASRHRWPLCSHSCTTAQPPCTPKSPGCSGK